MITFVFSLLAVVTPSAAAQEARPTDDSCPVGVPEDGFEDVTDDNVHEPAIDCVVWHDIARGTSSDRYSPARAVRRDQMATFVVETLAAGGHDLPTTSEDHFDDDEGSVHEGAINRLAQAAIVSGTSEGRYRPADPVTRAQMASYLRRAHDHVAEPDLPSGNDHFDDDDGSPHEPAIDAVAEVGIATGTATRAYSPGLAVRRDQMASFLVRLLDVLLEDGGGDDGAEMLVPPVPDIAATAYQLNPQHTGAVGTLSEPSQSLEPAWAVDLGGDISYPVITADTVFVIADREDGGYGTTLYALAATDGSLRWRSELGGSYYWGGHTYEDGRVFTVDYDGVMQAFDADDGRQLWVRSLPIQNAFTSPPTVHDGIVYVGGAGSGGTLYAVDAATGELLWDNYVENGDHSSPAVTDEGVYVSYACNQSYAFEPTSGELLWHHDSSCAGGGGRTVVVHGDRVYTRDHTGNLVLDASNGSEVGVHPAVYAPAFLGGTGFAIDESGDLVAFDVSTGEELWRGTVDGSVTTAPIVVGGAVYVGTELGELYAIDSETGEAIWFDDVGAPIPAPDEHNVASPLTGLGAAYGLLVVPTEAGLVTYR